jgi:hypothetical protein
LALLRAALFLNSNDSFFPSKLWLRHGYSIAADVSAGPYGRTTLGAWRGAYMYATIAIRQYYPIATVKGRQRARAHAVSLKAIRAGEYLLLNTRTKKIEELEEPTPKVQ